MEVCGIQSGECPLKFKRIFKIDAAFTANAKTCPDESQLGKVANQSHKSPYVPCVPSILYIQAKEWDT